jgi:hypothetical protein
VWLGRIIRHVCPRGGSSVRCCHGMVKYSVTTCAQRCDTYTVRHTCELHLRCCGLVSVTVFIRSWHKVPCVVDCVLSPVVFCGLVTVCTCK